MLQERARRYFDASHHCAGWRLRDGTWRALDAGEPSGSAGAPILAAIDALELLDAAVVVTRYFGGTKLGVGGLVRAYGEAASAALANAPKRRAIPAEDVRIGYPYELTSLVMRAVEQFAADGVTHGFDEQEARAIVDFTVPSAAMAELQELLTEQSGGALMAESLHATLVYQPTVD